MSRSIHVDKNKAWCWFTETAIFSWYAVAGAALAKLCMVKLVCELLRKWSQKTKHYRNVGSGFYLILQFTTSAVLKSVEYRYMWAHLRCRLSWVTVTVKFIIVNKVLCIWPMRLTFLRTMNLRVCGSGVVLYNKLFSENFFITKGWAPKGNQSVYEEATRLKAF